MPFDRDLVEARLALNFIPPNEMPKIAWDALEAGLDGTAIRRLAALEKPTWFQVNEILPNVMREMGLREIAKAEAAVRVGVQRAKEILEDGLDPTKFTREFWQLWIATGYENKIVELGTLDDDVYVARQMGKSENDIRNWLTEILKAFVAKNTR